MKPLSNVLPPGFTTSLDEFCSVLEKEGPFKPMGELLNVFSTKDKGEHEIKTLLFGFKDRRRLWGEVGLGVL